MFLFNMELNDYQKKAMTTCTESSNNLMYMLTGLNAEVGEINDKIAKAIRKGQIAIENNQLCENESTPHDFKKELIKEIGDVQWFCAGLANVLNVQLQEVCDINLDKLASRQKRGVIVGEGDNR